MLPVRARGQLTSGNRHQLMHAEGAQGFKLPSSLRATTNLLEVVAHADLLLLCVPTPYVASTMEKIREHLQPSQASAASKLKTCRHTKSNPSM